MKKTKLIVFAALSASFTFMTPTKVLAQEDVGDDTPYEVAPVIQHHFDFEDVVKDNFDDETLVIGGKRWAFHGARIVRDSILGIPHGKAAVQIVAGKPGGMSSYIELLDTIHGAGISFQIVHSGIDRMISRANCWHIQATFDDGATWADMEIPFDNMVESALYSTPVVPVIPGNGYRFRIIFVDGDNNKGEEWKVLVDNIMVVDGQDGSTPWYIQPGHLYNGFSTAEDSITFQPILSGTTWFLGPQDWGGTQSVKFFVDDETDAQVFEAVPLDAYMTAKNLSQGKHTAHIQFLDKSTMQPSHNALETTFDFHVKPITPIKGIKALLEEGKLGEFYELSAKEGKEMVVNWTNRTHAQRWLWDGERGILVDDPRYLQPLTEDLPSKKLLAKKVRGQLIKVNNNLVLQLDRRPELVEQDQDFTFINAKCEDLSLLTKHPEVFQGAPLTLYNVKFNSVGGFVDCRPNSLIEVKDAYGNSLVLNNVFADRFTQSRLPRSEQVMIFGIAGYSMRDGSFTVFPLEAHDLNISDGVETVAANETGVELILQKEMVVVNAPTAVKLTIVDMTGKQVWSGTVEGSRSIKLPQGVYIIKADGVKGKTVRKIAV